MKKIFIITILMLYSYSIKGQENFEWDVIVEAPGETEAQLYSKTKQFIAEAFVSAQDVLQNDDKEAGMILLKGTSITEVSANLHTHRAVFNFTTKIYVKDNKCRMVIENVHGISSSLGGNVWPTLPVADSYPAEKGYKKTSLSKKKYSLVMNLLKDDIQSLADGFKIKMSEPLEAEEDW